jgi:hypothetical protein
MSVERQSRRNTKMTSTTKMNAIKMVSSTSLIDARINLVMSNPILVEISDGKSFLICSNTKYSYVKNML